MTAAPYFCVFSLFIRLVLSWDLSHYNISSDYFVSSITIASNRAYLALPRSSCYNNVSNPTLVEVAWPADSSNFFIWKHPLFTFDQDWGNCEHLQDVVSVDYEMLRRRLWVLDKGSDNCVGKIGIYYMLPKQHYTINAPQDVNHKKMNSLLVDPSMSSFGTRVYVGVTDADYLLIFSMNEFKWWKVQLSSDQNLPISTQFISISRKDAVLYLTGEDDTEIYYLDLNYVRKPLDDDFNKLNISYLGEKLGPSTGLVSDFKDGLSYYLKRDYAIVRWNTGLPSEAENYNVLGQSFEILPFVSELFTGPQNGIWALVNKGAKCEVESEYPNLENRVVKVLKYNVIV